MLLSQNLPPGVVFSVVSGDLFELNALVVAASPAIDFVAKHGSVRRVASCCPSRPLLTHIAHSKLHQQLSVRNRAGLAGTRPK